MLIQIAAKYEEIYPPEVKELVYMVDNAYDAKQVRPTSLHLISESRSSDELINTASLCWSTEA